MYFTDKWIHFIFNEQINYSFEFKYCYCLSFRGQRPALLESRWVVTYSVLPCTKVSIQKYLTPECRNWPESSYLRSIWNLLFTFEQEIRQNSLFKFFFWNLYTIKKIPVTLSRYCNVSWRDIQACKQSRMINSNIPLLYEWCAVLWLDLNPPVLWYNVMWTSVCKCVKNL